MFRRGRRAGRGGSLVRCAALLLRRAGGDAFPDDVLGALVDGALAAAADDGAARADGARGGGALQAFAAAERAALRAIFGTARAWWACARAARGVA